MVGEWGVRPTVNQSFQAAMMPGRKFSTSSKLSTWGAMGSLTSMPRTFQSVSPPSLGARAPRILTCLTWPV